MTTDKDIDTTNKHLVGAHGDDIVILNPPRRLSHSEALTLAAWLVALAEENDGDFDRVLRAVLES